MALDADSPAATTDGSGPRNERTLGQLVAQATADIKALVSNEIALAKLEITGAVGHIAKGIPLLAVAGVLALFALGLLFTAAAWGLVAAGLSAWLGFLIVGVVILLVAALAALLGIRSIKRADPKPKRAIANAEQTIEALKTAQKTGSVHAAAIPASRSEAPLRPRDS